MNDFIALRYSDAPGTLPSPAYLLPGEVALNRSDGMLYYLHTSGEVRSIGDLSSVAIRPGGPGFVTNTGIQLQGGAFWINDTVLRTNPEFVPGSSSNVQQISGMLIFTTERPRVNLASLTIGGVPQPPTDPSDLLCWRDLQQTRLQALANVAPNTFGNVYRDGDLLQYDASNDIWRSVSVLSAGEY